MSRLAVFAYASLVSPSSAALSLGRDVEIARLARLEGWRRRWTTYRDNRAVEKTFGLVDGTVPPFVLGLNLEPDPNCPGANGALIEITDAEADRLDLRELRYHRAEVTTHVRTLDAEPEVPFDQVIAYLARPEHHSPTPPPEAIIIAPYLRTVEAAFTALGDEHLATFRATTDPPPVEPVDANLIRDHIPAGNPRRW